jgi:hypothetical protein
MTERSASPVKGCRPFFYFIEKNSGISGLTNTRWGYMMKIPLAGILWKESEAWKRRSVAAAVTRRRCVPRRNAGN